MPPPPVDHPERGADAPTSIFRESFTSRDAALEEQEKEPVPTLERSETMASVQFLLAHQPSRRQPGRITERKCECTLHSANAI